MTPIRINVSFREGVLDPAAQTISRSLHNLGFDSIQDLTLSKQIDLCLDEQDPETALNLADDMCKRLLVNEVMETYTIKVRCRADKG